MHLFTYGFDSLIKIYIFLTLYYCMHFISLGSCQEDADFESRFPFANSGNPVMAMVSDQLKVIVLY